MKLEDYDTQTHHLAVVRQNKCMTPDASNEEVRELVLELQATTLRPEAGQSVGVLVPGPHEFGNPFHFRLYTVADIPDDSGTIKICVKRCFYIDDYNGEVYRGVASNFLCDRAAGDMVTLTGPYGIPFEIPDDDKANLLMIGMGTGIAPFRAFVKNLHQKMGKWKGQVRLFYGAKSGLEMLYMNDRNDDMMHYFDEKTYRAFEAVSPRPHLDDPIALDQTLIQHAKEVWQLVSQPNTYVYVAGLEKIRGMLDKAFSLMAGSEQKWSRRHAELVAGKRWTELIY